MELKFNIEFHGKSYLAEIIPMVNGQDMPVKVDMAQAEKIKQIYSRQVLEMLKKHEAGYKESEYGLLVAGTLKGFQFEKTEVAHTAPEWENFVGSLFHPAEKIADDERVTQKAEKREKFAEYKKSIPQVKKQVMITVFLKKYQEFHGEKVDYTPIEQQCLDCRNYKPFDLEDEVANLIRRLRKHKSKDDACEKKLSPEEELDIAYRYLAIEKAAKERAAAQAP